jgi:hypothetical protein
MELNTTTNTREYELYRLLGVFFTVQFLGVVFLLCYQFYEVLSQISISYKAGLVLPLILLLICGFLANTTKERFIVNLNLMAILIFNILLFFIFD